MQFQVFEDGEEMQLDPGNSFGAIITALAFPFFVSSEDENGLSKTAVVDGEQVVATIVLWIHEVGFYSVWWALGTINEFEPDRFEEIKNPNVAISLFDIEFRQTSIKWRRYATPNTQAD